MIKKQLVEDKISSIEIKKDKLNVLSFFSGAMGLDIGLEKSGLNVLMACEIDKSCRETIVTNQPQIGLIGDIRGYSIEDILHFANVKNKKSIDVIVGGPPCQAFSTAGKRMGFEDERGNVFLKYIDVIADIKPKYAVIENVRGLLSSILTIDIEDEVFENIPLEIRKAKGSTMYYIVEKLKSLGYSVSFNLYNAANFGVPQVRERVVIICSLTKEPLPFLTPTHSNQYEQLPNWNSFKSAVDGLKEDEATFIPFAEKRLKYINMLKAGQYWKDLPISIQEEAMGGSFHLGGGKTGFYRRLDWNKPSPTLVTHPAMPATELAHPVNPRPLSIQEYKRVQQFPDDWNLCGKITDQYKQVGNAIPIGLGIAIGNCLLDNHLKRKITELKGFKYSRYNNTSHLDFINGIKKVSGQITIDMKF